jgi:hypothetical protein
VPQPQEARSFGLRNLKPCCISFTS